MEYVLHMQSRKALLKRHQQHQHHMVPSSGNVRHEEGGTYPQQATVSLLHSPPSPSDSSDSEQPPHDQPPTPPGSLGDVSLDRRQPAPRPYSLLSPTLGGGFPPGGDAERLARCRRRSTIIDLVRHPSLFFGGHDDDDDR